MSDYTPRFLVEYTCYETREGDTVDHVAYEAVQQQGVLSNGPGYERRLIGVAEFEPYTNIGRSTHASEFAEVIEDTAERVAWLDRPEACSE